VPLMLYNTATRTKEPFHPLENRKVGMYVCGVTVYDLCHIGHARSALVFDVLSRHLRARGMDLTYVRNFTDVDDKIIQRARETGKDPSAVAERYIAAFYEDMGRLGVLPADHEPRATQHIDGMIRMIETLLAKGHAYVQEGDVYFSVQSFPGYGALSGRRLEDMEAGHRVAVDEKKRHPMDFALWKRAKEGEPFWPSPWGEGRPGWHLECSVMSHHFLGPTFDIHGGGRDLLFPHHENERAQSLAAYGGAFARYWVHNGFVTVEREKMSKSLGNFVTVREALDTYHPEVLRLFLLSKHYRTPLDFSRQHVLASQAGLVRIYRALERLERTLGPLRESRPCADRLFHMDASDPSPSGGPFVRGFVDALDDDLNTAEAIARIFELIKEIHRLLDEAGSEPDPDLKGRLSSWREELLAAGEILGILQRRPATFFEELAGPSDAAEALKIQRLVDERAQARARKDWSTADAIRDKLRSMGVVLEDGPGGTTWRRDV